MNEKEYIENLERRYEQIIEINKMLIKLIEELFDYFRNIKKNE